MTGLITPLNVCGGSGTRLWPVSRESLPKQFLPLFGEYSTFQETVLRVSDPGLFGPPVIITHRDYRSLVDAQLRGLGVRGDILLEPERRGSGPAILAGALWAAAARGGDTVVLALAADHIIRDGNGFRQACRAALAPAETGAIVTFGVAPDHPATGYGYIEAGETLHPSARAVRRFVEKPNAEKAARYVSEGYLWNSGNLLFRASSLLDEYRLCDGATVDAVAAAVKEAGIDVRVVHLDKNAFARATSRSIDYAVMEKTARAVVVPVSYDWSDIGSWDAVHKFLSREATGDERSLIRSLTVQPDEFILLTEEQPEYWIVASGTGTVTIAGEAVALTANKFILIPAATSRRIENRGESDLRIVTVASAILQP